MIRIGIVDFDTSHCVEFTKRLNHVGIAEEQWVDGARVVAGCPLPSQVTAPEKVEEYARAFREFGLPLVDRPEELMGRIDAVFIEANDGSVHLERARPFLEAGIPTWIDKPLACSVADARELVELAARKNVPLFSSSSLRFAPEVVAVAEGRDENGAVLGCDTYGPAATHPRNPGLFHYGIHGVETLYTIMGPGCESVRCVSEEGAEVAVGRWKGGRLGTHRGTRAGSYAFGFTAFCEKRVIASPVGMQFIYRELLKQVVATFESGCPPIDPAVSLEIVAFIEAALKSAKAGGDEIRVEG